MLPLLFTRRFWLKRLVANLFGWLNNDLDCIGLLDFQIFQVT